MVRNYEDLNMKSDRKGSSSDISENGEVTQIHKVSGLLVSPLFRDEVVTVFKGKSGGKEKFLSKIGKGGSPWMEFTVCLEGKLVFLPKDDVPELKKGQVMIRDGLTEPLEIEGSENYRGITLLLDEKFGETGEVPEAKDAPEYWEDRKDSLLRGESPVLREGDVTLSAISEGLFRKKLKTPMDVLDVKTRSLEIIRRIFEDFFRKEELWKKILRMNEERRDDGGDYTLGELSRVLGISEYKINRHFQQVYGGTYTEFMRHRKIEEARRLLRETSDNILDIAAEMGFENPGKFSVMFKRETGMTPREYRKNI